MFLQQVLMATRDEMLFTLFDYVCDPVDISVHSAAESPTADALNAAGPE
jgi:hypothetical protein